MAIVNMKTDQMPLVSVTVITYNSELTVIDTLNSVFCQTYRKLELIVSDDRSSDDTVSVCKKWIKKHENRFVRVCIIESKENTGISANINRADAVCTGEWVKGIAGDDKLLPGCIETFIDFCLSNKDSFFVFSGLKAFGSTAKKCQKWEKDIFKKSFFEESPSRQLDILMNEGNCVPASTFFYNRQKMLELGIKNDERIPLLEDWPKWINLLKKGVRFSYIDSPLVGYRISSGISNSNHHSLRFLRSLRLFYYYYQFSGKDRLKDDEIVTIVDNEMRVHEKLYKIRDSHAYRIYSFVKKLFSCSLLK